MYFTIEITPFLWFYVVLCRLRCFVAPGCTSDGKTLGSPLRPIAAAATEAARTDRCPCRFMPLPPFKALTAKSSHLSNTSLYLSGCVAPHACGESRVYTSGLGKVQRFVNIR